MNLESRQFREILHEIRDFMRVRYQKLKSDFGLSPHQFILLYHVRSIGPTAISGLKGFVPGHLSGIGQMVDRLVQGGWLVREQDPEDRRRLIIHLSPKAKKTMGKIEPFGMARAIGKMKRMNEKDRREAVDALKRIASLMGVDPGTRLDADPSINGEAQETAGSRPASQLDPGIWESG